jgi:signal transduction histidine kinase
MSNGLPDREQFALIGEGLDRLEQGLAIFGPDLCLVLCNRRALQLLDLPESFARPGTALEDVFRYNAERGEYGPGDVPTQVRERMARARSMEWHSFERQRRDGVVLRVEGHPLPGGGFVSVFTDITHKRTAEHALREREQMLASVVEGLSIATFVIDAGHRVRHWNAACVALTGWSSARMLGTLEQWRAFYGVTRPVLADLVLDQADEHGIARYYGAGRIHRSPVVAGAYEGEHFFPDVGDGGRWLFFTAAPLRAADGEIIGAVETLQDVTERNRAREQIERYRENLEAQVAARTAELANANEELSQYAYAVSHDLRAPLRAVRNYADFLREDIGEELEEEQRGYLDGMQRALRQGEELIDDLLDYSRVGRSVEQPDALDLGALLRELLEPVVLDQTVEVDIAAQWPTVHADRVLVRQVFQNLISNAVKFNRSVPRRVELAWRPSGAGHVEVMVRDNGIGIAERHAEQVFRIFQRLHTHSEFPGAGIGLAIVKKALSRLGGSVRMESEPGAGSAFFVTLARDAGVSRD